MVAWVERVSADDVARVSEFHDAIQHQLRRGHQIRAILEGRPWLGPCPRSRWHDAIVSNRLLATHMKRFLRCELTKYQQCRCHVESRLRAIENDAEWITVVAGQGDMEARGKPPDWRETFQMRVLRLCL